MFRTDLSHFTMWIARGDRQTWSSVPVELLGSYITVVVYPSSSHFAALGISRSKEMKKLMVAAWIISGIEILFGAVYYAFMLLVF